MTFAKSIELNYQCLLNLDITPKLVDGITLDAERVTRMAGQGAVFLRSLAPLESEDEGETDEELEYSVLDKSPR